MNRIRSNEIKQPIYISESLVFQLKNLAEQYGLDVDTFVELLLGQPHGKINNYTRR